MANDHTADSHCTVDPASDCCTGCGVYHGDPCPSCEGRGFHREGCADADPPGAPVHGDPTRRALYLEKIAEARGHLQFIIEFLDDAEGDVGRGDLEEAQHDLTEARGWAESIVDDLSPAVEQGS